jgi:hydroxypyruvate isomerase
LLALCPGLSLSLDLSHFAYHGLDQAAADPLLGRTAHVHLRQAAPGVMQARAHDGSLDFRKLIAQLDARGYDGYYTIEYQCEEWLDCNRVDCISETAALRDVLLA